MEPIRIREWRKARAEYERTGSDGAYIKLLRAAEALTVYEQDAILDTAKVSREWEERVLSEFWYCNVCHAQNHEIDGECQQCECQGAECKRDNCSDPEHFTDFIRKELDNQ